MPGYFFDTSALVKRYHPEVGSAEVDGIWNDPANELFISRLATLEVVAAFAGKVRAATLSRSGFDVLRRRFASDVAIHKRPRIVRLVVAHFKATEQLLRGHGLTVRLRTLDAVQLAVALDLRQRGVVSHFVCSDRDLLSVATHEGLTVVDPEYP
jgi:predicted nucleic acid-binding protein